MLPMKIFLGAILFFVGLTPFVFCKDAFSIKREILDMEEHARILTEENTNLDEKYAKLKEECDININRLRDKNQQVDEQLTKKKEDLAELVTEHRDAKTTERFSMDALNTAYTKRNKYALKVELYTQELEQLQHRRKTGLSERCILMKPQFDKFQTKLATRSLPNRQKLTDRAEIVRLQNELNKVKVIVTELIGKNTEKKRKIEDKAKFCEEQLQILQKKYASELTTLSSTLQDLDLLRIEVKELNENALLLQKQQRSVDEDALQLKSQADSLKNQIETFFEDKQCYSRIADLNILFK